jgi:hypothetical protein
MRVYVESLRQYQQHQVREALRADGWDMQAGGEGRLLVRHRLAPDEASARRRLHELGLLSAAWLRIEFRQGRQDG